MVLFTATPDDSHVARRSPKYAGDPSLVALGEAIRSARKSKKLSMEALADLAGLDRSYLGSVERGEHNVAIMNCVKIAKALRIKLHQLFEAAGM